jgi:hypothetical protein
MLSWLEGTKRKGFESHWSIPSKTNTFKNKNNVNICHLDYVGTYLRFVAETVFDWYVMQFLKKYKPTKMQKQKTKTVQKQLNKVYFKKKKTVQKHGYLHIHTCRRIANNLFEIPKK